MASVHHDEFGGGRGAVVCSYCNHTMFLGPNASATAMTPDGVPLYRCARCGRLSRKSYINMWSRIAGAILWILLGLMLVFAWAWWPS
jgi:hypothetical protein